MEISNRYAYALKAYEIDGINERAAQIFNAVQGIEIDTAVSLLEWCSRRLLHQKCEITPDFLREACE